DEDGSIFDRRQQQQWGVAAPSGLRQRRWQPGARTAVGDLQLHPQSSGFAMMRKTARRRAVAARRGSATSSSRAAASAGLRERGQPRGSADSRTLSVRPWQQRALRLQATAAASRIAAELHSRSDGREKLMIAGNSSRFAVACLRLHGDSNAANSAQASTATINCSGQQPARVQVAAERRGPEQHC
ncbi:hypothetical protein Dimus_031515, partial [Dionaea muscipula]